MNQRSNQLFNSFKEKPILQRLILLNIFVFVLFFFLELIYPDVGYYLALPETFDQLLYRPWTLLTYMFMHDSFWHLFMNMLWLYWFGTLFINYLNPKQLIGVFLLGGFAGAGVHLLVSAWTKDIAYVIGSSGAVMSVVFAIAAYKPDFKIRLLFIGDLKLKHLAAGAFVLDLMGLASSLKYGNQTGIANLAHIGGSFLGLWFGYSMRKGRDITRKFNQFLDNLFSFFERKGPGRADNIKFNIHRNDRPEEAKTDEEYNQEKAKVEIEINRILEKISRSGYKNLTKKEKEFLFKQKND